MGDRVYFVYLFFLVSLVAIVPVVRVIWLGAISTQGLALLGSPSAPLVAQLCAVALWCAALLVGRNRGPAVLSPFLTYALGTSALSRRRAFAAPVVRAGLTVTLVTGVIAAVIAVSLLAGGAVTETDVAVSAVAGLGIGAIAAVAWLCGQALPRLVAILVPAMIVLAALTVVLPALAPFTPWGWVALAYPVSGSSVIAAISLGVLAALTVVTVPWLLDRLDHSVLTAQAARWATAATHAGSMDLSTAASTYTTLPSIGRRLRAIRPGAGLWLTFLRRSAVGAVRTPGRLAGGVVGLSLGGVLIAGAFLPSGSPWMLGAAAGLVVFMAVGPLTDGVRHVAHVASDLPLYGVSDSRLLAMHAVLPVLIGAIIPTASAVIVAFVTGTGMEGVPLAALLGALAVLGRVSNALKGPMPPELLTPIPTPMGDLAALVRLVWALDGALIAALCGVGAAQVYSSPWTLLVVAAILIGIGLSRWRRRR